jgi:hypothetical protein
MIATVFARIIPPRTADGFHSSGFDLPRFQLSTESDDRIPGNGNGFTTCEEAGMIAADVALYGRAPGTHLNLTVIAPGDVFMRYYRVNADGRLSSVPETEIDPAWGIPTALIAHTS